MGLIKTQNIGMGDWLGRAETVFWNRTGSTLTRGQVAMCDLSRTQGETTTFKVDGVETDVHANLTPVTQTLMEEGYSIVVCLSDSVPDNTTGIFKIFGRCEVAVLDNDVATTDLVKGASISMLVSDTGGATAVERFATGAAAGNRYLGNALEDAAADSNDTDRKIDANSHLRWCFWMGGIPGYGRSDT